MSEEVSFTTHPAKRLTIYLGTRDRVQHRSLVVELVRLARRAELAGATVFQGQSGFGRSGQLHRMHLVSEDAPETVVVVDTAEAVEAFVESARALLADVLVVVDDVEIVEL